MSLWKKTHFMPTCSWLYWLRLVPHMSLAWTIRIHSELWTWKKKKPLSLCQWLFSLSIKKRDMWAEPHTPIVCNVNFLKIIIEYLVVTKVFVKLLSEKRRIFLVLLCQLRSPIQLFTMRGLQHTSHSWMFICLW